jgi:hypothetical protein
MVKKSISNITLSYICNTGKQAMTEQFFPPETTECAMCGSTSRYQGFTSICRHGESWAFECDNCGLLMTLYPWPQET